MKKLLLMSLLSAIASCGVVEQDFFYEDIDEVSIPDSQKITLDDSIRTSATLPMSYIMDSIVVSISRERHEYMFSITQLQNDSLIGLFCRRGRSDRELLDCLPVMNTYRNDEGDVCAGVFSYADGRLFLWNISKSMVEGRDVYEGLITLHNKTDDYVFLSGYRANDSCVVANNSKQLPSIEYIVEPPRYEMYSINTGELLKSYNIFKKVNYDTTNPLYTSKSFPGKFDCISPDGTKIAFGMAYMPVYGILDLISSDFKVFRIKGLKRFSTSVKNWHFCNLVSDNEYIYSLYYGLDISDPYSDRGSSTLFVFDWDGNLISQYVLDKYVTEINLTNETLYFSHRNGVLFKLPISRLSL